ncbi:MAG: FAD:protein FMN transferase [Planctomycetes bacterium]|nr:FAD:protein FMN transferase [Planctomycetota bacterium]
MTDAPPDPDVNPSQKTGPLAYAVACAAVVLIVVLGFLSSRQGKRASDKTVRVVKDQVRVDSQTRKALGTQAKMSVVTGADRGHEAEQAIEAAFARVEEVEQMMSHYRPDSDVSRLNDSGKEVVSAETFAVLKKAKEVSALTDGAFDITVPPLIRLWKSAAKRKTLPTEADLKAALALVGWKKMELKKESREVSLKKGMAIDLGGIAKGYAVDAAAKALNCRGFQNVMVEIGGEVVCTGRREDGGPWKIGVQDPRSHLLAPQTLDIILGLSDIAVATSGNYMQFTVINGKRHSHIIDPRSGWPADNIPSATIIALDCTTADALATAVSVMGVEKGIQLIDSLPDVEAMLITMKDDKLVFHKSKGFDRYIIKTEKE